MSELKSSLVSRIQSSTNARLIGWQFAADGRWDVAERAFFEHTEQRTLLRIEEWLAVQTTENIAFESLFESDESERLFFGVRITHLTKREKSGVIQKVMALGRNGDGIAATIQNVRSVLGDQKLADTTPEYLELGVFDLWNRVKSLVVWKRGEALGEEADLVMPDELTEKAQIPDAGFAPLHGCQTKPLMLEAAWKRDPAVGNSCPCWLGLPVSDTDRITGKYCLSESRYLSAVSTFIGHDPA